jgi:hypothetical protein
MKMVVERRTPFDGLRAGSRPPGFRVALKDSSRR